MMDMSSIDAFLDRFAVYIISHKRPDRVDTWRLLNRYHYTGKRDIVIDDSDPTAEEYIDRFGSAVRGFSKSDISWRSDRWGILVAIRWGGP